MTEEIKGCPVCEGHNIRGQEVDIEGNDARQYQICDDCGSSWMAIYTLSARNITERSPDHPLDARAFLKLAFKRIPSVKMEVYYEGDEPAGLMDETLTIDDIDKVMAEIEACDETVLVLYLLPADKSSRTIIGKVVFINSNSPEEQIADHSCGVLMKTFFPELEID